MKTKLIGISLVIMLGVGVGGCVNTDSQRPGISSSQVIDISVATVENSLTLALISAKVYTDLPRCGTGPKICSKIEIVRQIRQYAVKAHDAVVMARKNQSMIGLAISAVSEFNNVLPKE